MGTWYTLNSKACLCNSQVFHCSSTAWSRTCTHAAYWTVKVAHWEIIIQLSSVAKTAFSVGLPPIFVLQSQEIKKMQLKKKKCGFKKTNIHTPLNGCSIDLILKLSPAGLYTENWAFKDRSVLGSSLSMDPLWSSVVGGSAIRRSGIWEDPNIIVEIPTEPGLAQWRQQAPNFSPLSA